MRFGAREGVISMTPLNPFDRFIERRLAVVFGELKAVLGRIKNVNL